MILRKGHAENNVSSADAIEPHSIITVPADAVASIELNVKLKTVSSTYFK